MSPAWTLQSEPWHAKPRRNDEANADVIDHEGWNYSVISRDSKKNTVMSQAKHHCEWWQKNMNERRIFL